MEWFNDYGHFLQELPADCVRECSSMGQVDDAVAYWRSHLGFTVPRDKAIQWLSDFGAWPIESDAYDTGLSDMSDDDLADKVLWLACCDIRENGEWMGLVS